MEYMTFSEKKDKSYKAYSMELAGRTLTVDIGRVAAQANGAALMHYGDTTVLCTATASDKPRDGIDFFPLSVEYEEKLYSVGKIPGGFNKREGKASENAILTSRVIDRPMRPLFPKDYRNDVTLNNMVMSVDPECRPELVAMIGSAIVTSISDIPFDGPCATTQMGLVDGEFVVNPNQEQWKNGDLQLTVASTSQKVIMIEAGANEVPEDKMIEAIYKCHEINQTIITFINQIVAEVGKAKHEYTSCAIPEEMFAKIKEIVPPEEMEGAVFTDEKQVREENIRKITEKLEEAFADNEEWLAILGEAIYQYQKKTVRKMILKDHKRPDGRATPRFREFTVWRCSRADRHRSARLRRWRHCQRFRRLMVLMRMRQRSGICIITISRPIPLARQSRREGRDAGRLVTVHWRRRRSCRCFLPRKRSHMQSARCQRHLSQTVPPHRALSVRLPCH